MTTEIVEQLEAQVVAMQFLLCNKQKQMQDYFKRTEPRDDMELESIDTTVASVAALMKETPTLFSTPKHTHSPAIDSTSPTPLPEASTSTANASVTTLIPKPSAMTTS